MPNTIQVNNHDTCLYCDECWGRIFLGSTMVRHNNTIICEYCYTEQHDGHIPEHIINLEE